MDGPHCPVDIVGALAWRCMTCGRGRGRGDPPIWPVTSEENSA